MGAPWNYSVVIQVFGRGTRLSSDPNRTINLLQIVDDSIVSKNPHLISLAKERAQRVMFGELEKPITLDAMKKEYNTTYSGALSNPIAQFLRSKQKSLRIKNIIPTELLFSGSLGNQDTGTTSTITFEEESSAPPITSSISSSSSSMHRRSMQHNSEAINSAMHSHLMSDFHKIQHFIFLRQLNQAKQNSKSNNFTNENKTNDQ